MASRERKMPPKQRHAEGSHGDKTHRRHIEQLEEGARASDGANRTADVRGHHRLLEDRQQHDEAEKGSELGRKS
jgi:hypothetical protein